MNILVDFDDTLYNTHAENCGTVAELLLSYLNAPLFDGAKEVLQEFCKNGHKCFGITARGLICEDEIPVTKLRLRKDGLFCGKGSLITGVIAPNTNKYSGIEYLYENYYKQEVQPDDCVLIDDCLEAMMEAADNGVQCILFSPKMEELSASEQEILSKLKINVAHSWEEVKKLVDDRCQVQEEQEKQEQQEQKKETDENKTPSQAKGGMSK